MEAIGVVGRLLQLMGEDGAGLVVGVGPSVGGCLDTRLNPCTPPTPESTLEAQAPTGLSLECTRGIPSLPTPSGLGGGGGWYCVACSISYYFAKAVYSIVL